MNEIQKKEYHKYLNKGFDEEQLYEIQLGIEQGHDVTTYARIGIPASEMSHIRKSMNYQRKVQQVLSDKQERPSEPKKPDKIKREKIAKKIKFDINSLASVSIAIGILSILVAIVAIIKSVINV